MEQIASVFGDGGLCLAERCGDFHVIGTVSNKGQYLNFDGAENFSAARAFFLRWFTIVRARELPLPIEAATARKHPPGLAS